MQCIEIVFSPTGGTQKAADLLTTALGIESTTVDLTDHITDFSVLSFSSEDIAVIAVPSYGGRVPAPAVQRLRAIHGNNARAVLMCVYGNRAYEDTLVELEDAARQAGFRAIAAVAAVAEHSIAHQYAAGRPDNEDKTQLRQFAQQIQAKLSAGDCSSPKIPGNRPYRQASRAGMVPKPIKACNRCGLCAAKCPVQAIDYNDPHRIDRNRCISCMRCVSICPQSARKINSILHTIVNLALKKSCTERKTGELYL